MPSKEEYLDLVSKEIRFKAARKVLRRELGSHILDTMDELEKKGEKNVEEQAVAAMGDAAQIGMALDAVHRPRIEWHVLLCILLLSVAGVIISFTVTEYGAYIMQEHVFFEMVIPMIMGLVFMVGLHFLNYAYLIRLRYVFYGAALIYSGLYIIFNARYQPWQPWMTQMSVIVISTLLFILGIIGFIEQRKEIKPKGMLTVALFCIVPIVVMSIINLNNGLLIAVVCIGTYAAAYFKKHTRSKDWRQFLIFAAIIVVSYFVCYMLVGKARFGSGYAFYERIFSRSLDLDVSKTLEGARFVGPSTFYLDGLAWYLWGSRTGYIITAVIGAYGWLAGIGVMSVSVALCLFMLSRSFRITHHYGRLLSVGITVFFLTRVVFCIATNLGLFGGMVNLPFISFGRFDYIADTLLVGVFLSVWRRSTFMKEDVVKTNKRPSMKVADATSGT